MVNNVYSPDMASERSTFALAGMVIGIAGGVLAIKRRAFLPGALAIVGAVVAGKAALDAESSVNPPAYDHPVDALLLNLESGLFSEDYFLATLDARVSTARRHLRPLSIVFIEFSTGRSAAEGSSTSRVVPGRSIAGAIVATLREADTACHLDNGQVALVLEETPDDGAVWTVERMRRQLSIDDPTITVHAGVAAYPAQALDADSLVAAAKDALVEALAWPDGRIEVAASVSGETV